MKVTIQQGSNFVKAVKNLSQQLYDRMDDDAVMEEDTSFYLMIMAEEDGTELFYGKDQDTENNIPVGQTENILNDNTKGESHT